MALAQQLTKTRMQQGVAPRHGPVAPRRAAGHVARAGQVARAAPADASARFVPRWPAVYEYLRDNKLQTVTPEDASQLLASGDYVLVDVRRPDQFAKGSPKGSVNVPLYRKIEMGGGFDAMKFLRTAMYAFNGVDPIEPNLNFANEVSKATQGGKGVIFACEAGGTMKPTMNFPTGKPSRSLQACYKAANEAGIRVNQIKHLERGIYGWYQAGNEFTGDYKPEIGRFPSAAAEPMLQAVNQSRGYEIRPDDKRD